MFTPLLETVNLARHFKRSRTARQPVKISRLLKVSEGKIPVICAKLLDDERLLEVPENMKIVAYKCSHSVKRKVESKNGKIFTLDQIVKVCEGDLSKLEFVKTPQTQRKANKYFGKAPGEKGSTTYPRANNKCKNKEKRINMPKKVVFDFEKEHQE